MISDAELQKQSSEHISDDNNDDDNNNDDDGYDNDDEDDDDDSNDEADDDDDDNEGCKLQMQSAGWQRLLHTHSCPSSHAEGTGAAHYLKTMTMTMTICCVLCVFSMLWSIKEISIKTDEENSETMLCCV